MDVRVVVVVGGGGDEISFPRQDVVLSVHNSSLS